MRRITSGGCVLALVALLHGCKGDDKAGQTATAPPPEVMVSQVVSRDVTDYAEFTGRTDAVDTVEIRSRVNGYLTETYFTDGEEVKPQAVLFQIDPRPFEAELKNAEGQKGQWQAKQAQAKADVARYEKLVPTGAATAQDLDKAMANMGEATAAIQSSEAAIDRAKLDLEFSRITAPLGGQISKSSFSKGNLIRGDSDLLTTIVSLDPMNVYFNVNERTLLQLRKQELNSRPPSTTQPDVRSMKIPVYVALGNEEGYPHQGVIDFADNMVDPSTGTIRVRGVLDNSKREFKPGFFVRVRVPTSEPHKSILVTDRAVATDQSQKFVYVVDDKSVAQYRAVKLGRLEDDGLRVVTAGLQGDDSVIVTGIQRARPGKPVTPKRAEMPRIDKPRETPPAGGAPGDAATPKRESLNSNDALPLQAGREFAVMATRS